MRNWPAALIADLALTVTSIAYCWKVTRRDGQVFGFTECQEPLSIGGITYLPVAGFGASEVATRSQLNVDDLEIVGVLDAAGIAEQDLIAGLWNFAAAECFVVNFRDLSHGIGPVRKGNFGEIKRQGIGFFAELRGMMQRLQQRIGREVLAGCPWDLGDSHCTINLNTFTNGKVTTTVTDVTSQRQFTATGLTQAATWFEAGSILFNAGALNVGSLREIKTHATGGVITLQLPFPYAISVGESFTATVGDLKRRTEDCKNKFNNVINFGGFPDVPGNNAIISGL